ncbi:SPOR domain-containing protein [Bacteroidota bacterium]
MKLAKYISDLLFENNKLIIPGLGALIGTPQPAKINEDGQSISPPKKLITFDPNDKNADNVLARHISKSENITQIATKKIINDFVNDTIRELKEGKRVRLAEIGVFSMDQKGNILFNEEEDVNYLTDSFGLDKVKTTVIKEPESKPAETEEIKTEEPKPLVTEKNKVQSEEKVIEKIENDKKKIPVFIWILIVLFPIIVFLLTLWVVNPEYLDKQSKLLGEKIINIKESVFPIKDVIIEPDSTADNKTINDTSNASSTSIDKPALQEERNLPEPVQTDDKTNETANVKVEKPATTSGSELLEFNFYLIAGSFKDKSNASRLVSQLQKKGFDSKIIGLSVSGLHMVCYNGWSTREEAQKELYRIKVENNADSWIYVKK